MNLKMGNPNDILYFLELAQTLNFSRAAERIGISQPSLTTAIKRLEHTLKVELFNRNKHKVILTRAGKQLLENARQLLQLWEVTKNNCYQSETMVQGSIVLGCHPSIALYFLPTMLPNLLATYPKLEIRLRHDLSRKITEEVIDFRIDIGIVVNPIKHPNLVIKKLQTDKVTYWESTNKTLAAQNATTIICDPDLLQTQWLLKAIKADTFRIITSPSLEVIASLTEAGCGIGILPTSVVKNKKIQPKTNMPVFNDEICLIYRHENRHIKTMQTMVKAIKDAIEA